MAVVDVYSRQGCHLCEVLIEELMELTAGRAEVVVHDVDTRDDWRSAYGACVPVIEFRGARLCEFVLDRDAVLTALAVEA